MKRQEISERIKKLRELGDLSNNVEYDKAVAEQVEVEMEIMRLQSSVNSVCVDETKNSIFEFWGNDDFVKANINKKFTIEEVALIVRSNVLPLRKRICALNERKNAMSKELAKQVDEWIDYKNKVIDYIKANINKKFTIEEVALIVRSNVLPLRKRICALNERKNAMSKELAKQVDEWIDYKNKVIDYIKAIDDENIVFLINFNGNCVNKKIFRKYQNAIDNVFGESVVSIERISDNLEEDRGQIGSIIFNDAREIINVSYYGDIQGYEGFCSPLYNIKVSLNSPYNPFDLIELPFNRKYYIVADKESIIGDEKLKASVEHFRNSDWLRVDIPHCDLEYQDNLQFEILKSLPFSLDKIRKIDEENQTVYQAKLVEKIKAKIFK